MQVSLVADQVRHHHLDIERLGFLLQGRSEVWLMPHADKVDALYRLVGRFQATYPFIVTPPEFRSGWLDLIIGMSSRLMETYDGHWETTQIKEKFGGLRFYTTSGSAEQDIITVGEHLSESICEMCGAPGRTRGGGWIQTLCNEHAAEAGKS